MSHRALLTAGLQALSLLSIGFLALQGVLRDPAGQEAGPGKSSSRRSLGLPSGLEAAIDPPAATLRSDRVHELSDENASLPGRGPSSERPAEGEAVGTLPLASGEGSLLVVITCCGAPFPGAQVEVRDGPRAATGTTGGDGQAEFAGIAAGTYEVRMRAWTSPQASLSLRTSSPVTLSGGERLEVRCEVPEGEGEIAGRVLDPQGRPVRDIEVEARPMAFPGSGAVFVDEGPPALARTGPDGSFSIGELPRLEHILSTRECTRDTAHYPSVRTNFHSGSSEPVVLILGTLKTVLIYGIVRDDSGSPVAGAQVSSSTHPGPATETGSDGGYVVEISYERGVVSLSARVEGLANTERVVPASEVEGREEIEVDLLLEPLGEVGAVVGKVASAGDGSPVAGQVVCLGSPSLGLTYQVRSGEDGIYALHEVLPAADYRIWVNPDTSFKDYHRDSISVEAGTLRFDIALEPLEMARIWGRMVGPQGAPLPRLTLWVRSQEATVSSLSVSGDAQGRFALEDVPAGELVFETRAAPWISVRGVRLKPGEESEVEIPVGIGSGSVSGLVTDSLSRPVGGARLTLTWSQTRREVQSAVHREAVSDSKGLFRFSALAPGQAVLHAAARSYSDRSVRRKLTGGDDEVRIELTPAGR